MTSYANPPSPVATAPDSVTTVPEQAEGGLGSTRYLPGIDGLRACAVIAVMIGHVSYQSTLNWPWLKGEWLGVTTFFTLSGFLIARILLVERAGTGATSLSKFWTRRAKRLLPALYLAILATMFEIWRRIPPADWGQRGQLLATLFYVKNIAYANLHGSNGPTMFQFWSLSIEEQFYLFCPLIFVVGMRYFGKLWTGLIFAVLGVASSVYMYLSSRSGHWLLVYFSTATRVGEILAGVVLAFVATTVWFRRCETRRWFPPLARFGGLAGLVGLGLLWHFAGVTWTTFHRSVSADVICTLLVIVACSVSGPVSSILGVRPLRYLGRISYGAYVYHLVIFFWLSPARFPVLENHVLMAVVRIGVTFFVAGLSYRFIEQPLRHSAMSGGRVVAFYGSAAAGLFVLAMLLPIAPHQFAAPLPNDDFRALNRKATGASMRIDLIGDQLVRSARPGLHQVVDPHAGMYRVNLRAVPDCPLAGGGPIALAGRAVPMSKACSANKFLLSANLRLDRPEAVVVWAGIADLADRADRSQRWGHLGEAAFDARMRAALESLTVYLGRSTANHIDWYLLDPTTAIVEFRAMEQHSTTATGGATGPAGAQSNGGGTTPASPTDATLRQRVAILNALIRDAAVRQPKIRLHEASTPNPLDRAGWLALLSTVHP